MIIATAGHVDHGKTKLVEALSGVNTDRLPEEKQRGLTIDLGFAYVPVAGGRILGFVDVPGHEKFIRNMVAGISAIDYALLVIAADDGPMPQTVEHLAILDLLGVTTGAVAITKTDAVADSRIDEVKMEVREIMRKGGLEKAEIFPLSALSGEGVPALKSHLENAVRKFSAAPPKGRFRLAIDRMFNLTGVGLVVTGSVYSGRVAVGEKLLLSPAGTEVRVRAIHVHDRAAEEAHQGERAALNLAGPGAHRSDIRRGDWLLDPAAHAPTKRIDAEIRVLPSEAKAFKHETPAHLHLGALETPCRVAILSGREIAPGESGLIQIVTERLITAHTRDRLILRDQSARRTLAGGRIIDPYGPERGRARPLRLAQLDAMAKENSAAALATLLPLSPGGIDLGRFAVARNLDVGESTTLFAAAEMVMAGGSTTLVGISLGHWGSLSERIIKQLKIWHQQSAETLGLNEFELRRLFTERPLLHIFNAAIVQLIEIGEVKRSGTILHLPGHKAKLAAGEQTVWQQILPLLESGGLRPPVVRQIASELHLTAVETERVLKRAAALGFSVQVAKNRFLLPAAVRRLANIAEELAGNSEDGIFLAAQYRDRSGIGRNLTIELLEYFDRAGFTRRTGAARRTLCPASALFSVGAT